MELITKETKLQVVTNGLLASSSLLSSYFLVMRVATGSWVIALEQYASLWLLMSLLIVGFGFQVSLYTLIKAINTAITKGSIAASGVTSTGAMIACCAHHVVDILPIVGLAGLSVYLAEYQIVFLLIGVLSNIIGIGYLLKQYTRILQIKGNAFQEVVAKLS